MNWRRIQSAAAIIGLAASLSGPPSYSGTATRGAFGSTKPKGKHPAGSKLWRKARKGKL